MNAARRRSWRSQCARVAAFSGIVGALTAGCGTDSGDAPASSAPATDANSGTALRPATARWEMVDMLRESAAQEYHESDGGGRAWLEPIDGEPPLARVGVRGRFRIVYEAGPLGIVEGGLVFLQVSPFWNWSTPQTEEPLAPGYTELRTPAEGVRLEGRTLDQQLLGVFIRGRALAAGERVEILYGAGPAGVGVDRYAEKNSRFWIAVDGDGDGVRKVLADSPGVEVVASTPAQLVVGIPSTARVGDEVRVTLAVLDAVGNTGVDVTGEIRFDAPEGLELPTSVNLAEDAGGRASVTARVTGPGIHRLRATAPGGLEAESNPLAVNDGPRILWADLHGHSALSDGTGTPSDYFVYARDVAGLDVVALTDHDHWGMLPLDSHPESFAEITRTTRAFHAPGHFVTLLGYEWTSWIHGHRHVLVFDDEGTLVSSLDPATETPAQLWSALEGVRALTFAHHSAGGPIATNWEFPPDPHFEPVTEVVSVHGSSEAPDGPRTIYSPVPGNFVRDVLDRGFVLGFIGSGDSHDGHPGLSRLANPSGGLAAIVSEDLTRE
ncbi:MAG: DUF3604 domain-containing protein, partial [Myxococcales bacterium]|nr:DUF3604 domain-containing protein [Myxococcales bacterium]